MLQRLLLATLPFVPQPIMRRLAMRYIAGEALDQAVKKIAELGKLGHASIIDILGEGVTSEQAARSAAADYAEAADAIAAASLDAYVSVKPTHLGLSISEDLCFELYDGLARVCARNDQFLRVEMEDHPTTDATLMIFERLREEHKHVGIVLQSRLLRTPDDIRRLKPGPLDVRMVKGIYIEPEEIAHTGSGAIREAFVDCTRLLAERRTKLSLATHDEVLAEQLVGVVQEFDYTREEYEFQVLLGVRRPLWRAWRDAGHRVRVYVPYGPEWREYSIRRLRKNPQIFGHVLKGFFQRG